MTLRVEPRVKLAAELAAKRDRRSVTNMVEVLILNHCKAADIAVPSANEETKE